MVSMSTRVQHIGKYKGKSELNLNSAFCPDSLSNMRPLLAKCPTIYGNLTLITALELV